MKFIWVALLFGLLCHCDKDENLVYINSLLPNGEGVQINVPYVDYHGTPLWTWTTDDENEKVSYDIHCKQWQTKTGEWKIRVDIVSDMGVHVESVFMDDGKPNSCDVDYLKKIIQFKSNHEKNSNEPKAIEIVYIWKGEAKEMRCKSKPYSIHLKYSVTFGSMSGSPYAQVENTELATKECDSSIKEFLVKYKGSDDINKIGVVNLASEQPTFFDLKFNLDKRKFNQVGKPTREMILGEGKESAILDLVCQRFAQKTNTPADPQDKKYDIIIGSILYVDEVVDKFRMTSCGVNNMKTSRKSTDGPELGLVTTVKFKADDKKCYEREYSLPPESETGFQTTMIITRGEIKEIDCPIKQTKKSWFS